MITTQNIRDIIKAETKTARITEIYRAITAILMLITIILLLTLQCHCDCSFNNTKNSLPWDDNVTYDDESRQTNIDDLNKKVADGMITISMNADPIFENGKSKGNVQIENDKHNTRPQMIEIYLKNKDGSINKDKLVYRSGKIPVGGKINTVALDVELQKGNYAAWVGFNTISDNDEIIGTAGADIVLHILN